MFFKHLFCIKDKWRKTQISRNIYKDRRVEECMVFTRIKEALSPNDEKYEVLYHNYSRLKLENKKLKKQHEEEMQEHKKSVLKKVAHRLIDLYEDIESTKNSSFSVSAKDKNTQRLMMDINKSEKTLREVMKEFSLEEITPEERFYDPELHEVASYQDAKDMQKGLILKTVKKGFKFKGEVIKKPKVVVTK